MNQVCWSTWCAVLCACTSLLFVWLSGCHQGLSPALPQHLLKLPAQHCWVIMHWGLKPGILLSDLPKQCGYAGWRLTIVHLTLMNIQPLSDVSLCHMKVHFQRKLVVKKSCLFHPEACMAFGLSTLQSEEMLPCVQQVARKTNLLVWPFPSVLRSFPVVHQTFLFANCAFTVFAGTKLN